MVSIIIPVFNVEESLLRRCFQSILEQTYENYEVIVVDDGSDKVCSDILDEIEKQDVRIRLWHKENGGVSSARNFGINMAEGELICFVDSDDTVERFFLETAVGALKDDIDLLFGKTNWIIGEEIIQTNLSIDPSVMMYNEYCLETEEEKEDILRRVITWPSNDQERKEGFQPEVWCKIFRKSVLGDLRFDEKIAIGEDQVFVTEYLLKSRKICVVNTHWYNYYEYKKSSLRKNDSTKAEKFIFYYERMAKCFDGKLAEHLLPEKAYFTLRELMGIYDINKNAEKQQIQDAYNAYRRFKHNKLVKKYIKKIPLKSKRIEFKDVILCRWGLTWRGIKLTLLNQYMKFK